MGTPVVPPVHSCTEEEQQCHKDYGSATWPIGKITITKPTKKRMAERGISYVTASEMILLCKGLQRITSSCQREANVTTGHVKELMDTLCSSMDKKFHRMEYNHVLSETTALAGLRS